MWEESDLQGDPEGGPLSRRPLLEGSAAAPSARVGNWKPREASGGARA